MELRTPVPHCLSSPESAQQEEAMNAHLESNPIATANSMFKHFPGESMFQGAGVRHFEVWFRKLRRKAAASRPTTLRELSSQFMEYRTRWGDILAKSEDEPLYFQLPHVETSLLVEKSVELLVSRSQKRPLEACSMRSVFPWPPKFCSPMLPNLESKHI